MPCYPIYNTEMMRVAKEDFIHRKKQFNISDEFIREHLRQYEGPKKVIGWMCGGEAHYDHCMECGAVVEYLCDFPVDEGKTCDRCLCEDCATEIAPNIHYCPGHLVLWDEFVLSGGVKMVLENVKPFKIR